MAVAWAARQRPAGRIPVEPPAGAVTLGRMTVRVEVAWDPQLTSDERTRMLLAMAALPEVRRAVHSPDGRRTAIYAADLAACRVEAVLREAGLSPASVSGSLAPEGEAALIAGHGERFRPIGR